MNEIVLLADRLQFISLGTGKIHAYEETETETMCGRVIWAAATVMPQRSLGADKLCRNCWGKLKIHAMHGRVRIESEVGA